jgi:dimethylargininase
MITGTSAIVRDVPNCFDRAIQPDGALPIDVELAKQQHHLYCSALEELGLSLIPIEPDDALPDSCYVEDTAIVIGDHAVIANPGADSRRPETSAVEDVLRQHKAISRIEHPATLDGGDVLMIENRLYVGLSGRTGRPAIEQLRRILEGQDIEVIPVTVDGILHLKSACTYLGNDTIAWLPGHLDELPFSRYKVIQVPTAESHAGNCLAVNGRVMVPAGAPKTREEIEAAGFDTLEIDISESRKAGGGLTCSSIVF